MQTSSEQSSRNRSMKWWRPHYDADGQPAGNRSPISEKIGANAKIFLRSSQRQVKSDEHLSYRRSRPSSVLCRRREVACVNRRRPHDQYARFRFPLWRLAPSPEQRWCWAANLSWIDQHTQYRGRFARPAADCPSRIEDRPRELRAAQAVAYSAPNWLPIDVEAIHQQLGYRPKVSIADWPAANASRSLAIHLHFIGDPSDGRRFQLHTNLFCRCGQVGAANSSGRRASGGPTLRPEMIEMSDFRQSGRASAASWISLIAYSPCKRRSSIGG